MTNIDILIYPPERLHAIFLQSRTSVGGCMTLLIPIALSIYFAFVFQANSVLPDVANPKPRVSVSVVATIPVHSALAHRAADGQLPSPLGGRHVRHLRQQR